MNGAAVIADVVPTPHGHNIPPIATPASLLAYNISLNFSSILAMLPKSRLLARLRRGTFGSLSDASEMPSASVAEDWASTYASIPSTQTPLPSMDQLPIFPGPWGFFTSWYMLGLFVMAILLHRMQNVIIPSRIPARRSRHAYRFGPTFATPMYRHNIIWRRLYASILPLNFARTTTRLVLHLPSVYFLSKMLLVWSLLVLQTSEIFPTFTDAQKTAWWGILGSVDSLGKWCVQKEMGEICWDTFCAVCGAFLVEGLIKALDGMGSGFPIGNVNPNTSPFNLVGYAFLLHVYSSPIAHVYKPNDGSPSRPDKHVIITISIPLLQLTIFHILSISKRLSTHRLLPTALTSMLSLAHFHGTLFSKLLFQPTSSFPSATAEPSKITSTSMTAQHLTPYLGRPSGTNYPLLNYIPNIFETLLICIILLTVFLNAFVQLLVRGRVDRVLSGLGVGQGTMLHDEDEPEPGFFQSLPFEEDFGVLLLRVGIASLEATGLRGWGNEVAPINLPLETRKSVGSSRRKGESAYGMVRMGRVGVGEVQYGLHDSATFSSSISSDYAQMTETRRRKKKAGSITIRGFSNEVRTVDLGVSEAAEFAHGRWWKWIREVGAFLNAIWSVLKGLVVFLIERAKGTVRVRDDTRKARRVDRQQESPGLGEDLTTQVQREEVLSDEVQSWKEREMYQRFLRGEDITDDEDDDEGSVFSDEEEESEEGEDEDEEREAEAVGLFTDLLRNSGDRVASASTALTSTANSGHGSGEMVLAHLLHGSNGASPLTRRRWNALVRNDSDSNVLDSRASPEYVGGDGEYDTLAESASRTIFGGYDQEHDARRVQSACVICTMEARDIICWPCRCLAMCDTCREALASKSTPSKHRCPCCRQIVEGYSRIYIP